MLCVATLILACLRLRHVTCRHFGISNGVSFDWADVEMNQNETFAFNVHKNSNLFNNPRIAL